MWKILLFLCFSLFAERTEILFHLHDAGETYALLPAMRELKADYLVIATGVAKDLVVQNGVPKERLREFADLETIEPIEVVTGVANEIEGQTLDYFNKKGIPTFAFWDNFNSNGESPYFRTAHAVEKRASILLLPSESLTKDFPERATLVVGHPTLDPTPRKKIAVWIGGYGDQYEEAYQLFLEGKKGIGDVVFLMQHHPKTGLKNELPTKEAIAIADLVICHQSTAAFQALAANKPVLHVIPKNQTFDSLPLQKGLAKKVSSAEDFSEAVHEALEMKVGGFFRLMGIPKNSTQTLVDALMELIQ